jgi:hypothetical protein
MKWLGLCLAALLLGWLLWSTLSAQRYECDVCVEFRGRHACATASASSERAAARAAQATACGKLVKGRVDSMSCAATAPLSSTCRKVAR